MEGATVKTKLLGLSFALLMVRETSVNFVTSALPRETAP